MHYVFEVGPRDFVRRELYVDYGSRVAIIFYVYSGGYPSDIIFRIIAPDGREIYPRTKIERGLSWSFTTTQGGRYILEFDNTYSILAGKIIDLAVSIESPPTTVTVLRYITEYRTATTYVTVPTYITEYRTTTMTVPAILPGPTAETWLPLIIVLAVGLLIGLPIGYVLKRPQKT